MAGEIGLSLVGAAYLVQQRMDITGREGVCLKVEPTIHGECRGSDGYSGLVAESVVRCWLLLQPVRRATLPYGCELTGLIVSKTSPQL